MKMAPEVEDVYTQHFLQFLVCEQGPGVLPTWLDHNGREHFFSLPANYKFSLICLSDVNFFS